MKKKSSRKAKVASPKKEESPIAQQASSSDSPQPQGILGRGPDGALILMPDPRSLLLEAEQEPNYQDLSEYVPVIRTLREKGFTYRDIADWMGERGVDMDHNAVYRLFTKSMTDLDAADEARRAEDEEKEEAMRGS